MNEELKKRLLSLLWRVGGMVAVAVLGFIADPSLLELVKTPIWLIPAIGLIANEITKALNKKFELGRRVLGSVKRVLGKA